MITFYKIKIYLRMNKLLVQSDKIGIITLVLCVIHCLMTPILFVVKYVVQALHRFSYLVEIN